LSLNKPIPAPLSFFFFSFLLFSFLFLALDPVWPKSVDGYVRNFIELKSSASIIAFNKDSVCPCTQNPRIVPLMSSNIALVGIAATQHPTSQIIVSELPQT